MDLSNIDLNSLLTTAVVVGPIVSILTILARKLTTKYGVEVSKLMIQGFIFLLGVIAALVLKFAPQEILLVAGSIFMCAIAFYDVVIKAILKPVYKKNYASDALPEKTKK